jgi:hypothetical protein
LNYLFTSYGKRREKEEFEILDRLFCESRWLSTIAFSQNKPLESSARNRPGIGGTGTTGATRGSGDDTDYKPAAKVLNDMSEKVTGESLIAPITKVYLNEWMEAMRPHHTCNG